MRASRALLLLALTAAPLAAHGQTGGVQVVPVYRDAHHRMVYENALVRVLDVRVAPGETTLYHRHDQRLVGVVIAGARGWRQKLGDPLPATDAADDSIGTVFDNLSDTLPLVHRGANTDTVALRYIVGIQRRASGIRAPALTAESGLHLDRETTIARVYTVRLAPGQSTPVHRHAQPGLTVQVGPGTLRLEGTAPQAASSQSGAGTWWWRGAGSSHVIRNVGDSAVSVVEIDWR